MHDSDRLLTAQELATYLDIPVTTLYGWHHGCKEPQGFRMSTTVENCAVCAG